MKLNEIYTRILAALRVEPTPEGLLSYVALDGPTPLMVTDPSDPAKKRRLALATQEILAAADWDHVVPFHPLSEHLNRGVSPVMNTLVRTGMIRLTEVISSLIHQLLELAVDQSRHAKVSPAAQGILSALPNVDKKTLTNIMELLARVDMSPDRRLISMYLKRKGVYRGITSRLCVVSFPIMDQLTNDDRKIWGVSLRVKDIEALEALMQFILPNCDNPETYSAPSDSKAAPYFESFLDAYEKVATQLNKVIHVNRKELQMVEQLKTTMHWENLAEDLLAHRSDIPALEGNKGTVLDDGQLDSPTTPHTPAPQVASPILGAAPAAPARAPVVPQYPHAPAPQYPPQPSAPPPPQAAPQQELSLAERLAQRQQVLVAPPQYAPQYPPQYGAPPQYPPQYGAPPPNYPPQYPQQPPYPYPPQAPAPYPMQQQPYPTHPGYPPPQPVNAPVWMNNASGSAVVGATPAPPPQYGGVPMAGSVSGGHGLLF